MPNVNYQRVAEALGGSIEMLAPKRAKTTGGASPGMIFKVNVNGDVLIIEDYVAKVIDDLAEQVEDDD